MTRFRMSPLGAAINLALVLAAVAFWYWRRKRKTRANNSLTDDLSPSVDSTKFTDRGEEAEQSAFRTGDGVYSHGEFAGGEVPDKD